MRRIAAVLLAAVAPAICSAQQAGVAARGATGGLTIPSAAVLNPGDIAYSIGNYEEPQEGSHRQRVNQTFGVGLAPYFELFGRYANFQNPTAFNQLLNGPRDVS